ncbi:MAG: hypothetical protein P8Y13_03770 [Deinococcales bacterium]|jgi:hypothetical protein
MQRLDLPEIEDLAWCPGPARDASTAFLAFLADLGRPYDALAPKLARALRVTGSRRIVDLASGAGGPWRTLRPLLAGYGADVEVVLTDRFPPHDAVPDEDGVRYHREPVDATAVPAGLHGFRTICGAFHHFAPARAQALLRDAVDRHEGIAVLEAVQRAPLTIALAALLPLPYLVVAPTLRPFGWSRLLWSYLLPAAPALLAVDGVASCLRAYTARDLRELTQGLESYAWEVGVVRAARAPLPATYLIGVPR